MYVKSLALSNFRCFKKLELAFKYPDSDEELPEYALPNVNLLLGNNGMGKSAMLKALALAAVSPLIEGAGYVPYSLVRREKNKPAKTAEVSCDFILQAQDLN
ncbi:MAG: AAA family ATPase [Planctomycetes bacterium]|nr:AAA family ATPase [Planctomycetota bacterium]